MIRTTIAFGCFLLIGGCSPSPGRFEVEMSWGSQGAPPDPATIFAQVKQLSDSNSVVTAPVVASATPIRVGGRTQLDFGSVPNGSGLVVLVEVREGPDPQSLLLRYGISAPFTLVPGEVARVPVQVDLAAPPTIVGPTQITIDGTAATELFVRQPEVQLILQTDTGVKAEISNFESFPSNLTNVFEIDHPADTDCRPDMGFNPACSFRVSWDLNLGFTDKCSEQDRCLRRVFVRFLDTHGIRSGLIFRDIILDTRSPSLTPEGTRISPPAAISNEPIRISLAFSEAVVLDSVTPFVEGSTVTLQRVYPGPSDIAANSGFQYLIPRASMVGPDGRYPVKVHAFDQAGNMMIESTIGSITVDNSVPEILNATLAPRQLGADRRNFEIRFSVSEDISPQNVILQLGLLNNNQPIALNTEACLVHNRHWMCPQRLGSEASGRDELVPISISVSDVAGNTASYNALSLDIDFVPPGVFSWVLSPPEVVAGRSARVSVVSTENIQIASLGWAQDALHCTVSSSTADSRLFDCPTEPGLNPRETLTLESIILTDTAGNTSTTTLIADNNLVVDRAAPTLNFTASLPTVTVNQTLLIPFEIGEVPDQILVTVAGIPAQCPPIAQPGQIICNFLITPQISPDQQEGFVPVVIEAQDLAGNVSQARGTVQIDRLGPNVVEASFASSFVGAGQNAFFSVTFNEAVGPAPPVLGWSGNNPGFAFERRNGQQFIFRLPVIAGSPADGTYTLTSVESADVFGNRRAIAVSGRSLTVDATVPQIVNLNVNPSLARAGQTIQATFQLRNDALSSHQMNATLGGLTLTCGLGPFLPNTNINCITGTLIAPNPPTTRAEQLLVRVVDDAGNQGQAFAPVTLDFEPPIVSSVDIEPQEIMAGGTTRLTVIATENIQGAVLTWGPMAPACGLVGQTGDSRRFDCVAPASDIILGQGGRITTQLLTAELTDLAGNTNLVSLAPLPGATTQLIVDAAAPIVTFSSSLPAVTVGSSLQIPFNLSERPANLRVTVGGQQAVCPPVVGPGQTVCSFTITAQTAPASAETSIPISIEAADVAGNIGRGGGSVLVDRLGPNVVEASFANTTVGAGQTAFLSVTFSERVATGSTPILRWAGADPGFVFDRRDGDQFVFRRAISMGSPANGAYILANVESTDLLGNSRTVNLTSRTLTVDATPPQISNLVATPSRARATQTIQATFQIRNDVIPTNQLSVRLGNLIFDCGTGPFNPDITVICTSPPLTPSSPLATTVEQLSVQATDSAGNLAQSSVPVVLDFVAPSLAAATVTYTPGPGNVLSVVSAARSGTTISLNLVANEEIQLPPATFAATYLPPTDVQSTLTFNRVTGSANPFGARYESIVPASGVRDGIHVPSLVLADLAGNTVTLNGFPGTNIDVRVSPPTLVVIQNQVSYVRAPLGNTAPENLGNFTIPPGPEYFALAPADGLDNVAALPSNTFRLSSNVSPTLIRIWADNQRRNLMGAARPEPNGTWSRHNLQLVNLDAPGVYVTGVDAAGNESASTRIENAWFIASSASPQLGISPHTLSTATRPVAPSELQTNVSGLATVGGRDGQSHSIAAQHRWLQRHNNPISGLREHAIAYDSARNRTVLLGDRNNFMETWEWDGNMWILRHVGPAGPPIRRRHAMTYDSIRGRVVLFGGMQNPTTSSRLNDFWEWDGTTWTEITYTNGPGGRFDHAMAFDSSRRRLVLFSGVSDALRNDTWEWDGNEWLDVSSPGPTSRQFHALIYHPGVRRIILIGGTNPDTWQWDGVTWQNNAPLPFSASAVIAEYDPDSEQVILVRGQPYLSSGVNQIWAWNGSTWALQTGTTPTLDYWSRIVHDGIRIIITSFNQASQTVSTFAWDYNSWHEFSSHNGSLPRWRHTTTYDESRRRTIVFGGSSNSGHLGDTWAWNGFSMERLASGGPSAREWTGASFSTSEGAVLLFGGFPTSNDLWAWDGVTWVSVAVNGPPPRAQHAMAYDRLRQRLFVFGGVGFPGPLGDTWEWDGTNWTSFSFGPPSRQLHRAVFDGARNQVVLFGGNRMLFSANSAWNDLRDTWEWDGNTWSDLTAPTGGPMARTDHALIYNPVRQRTTLIGGFNRQLAAPLSDSWEWNGTTWTPIASLPEPLYEHDATYDTVRNRAVIIGGKTVQNGNVQAPANIIWELLPPDAPSVQLAVQVPVDLSLSRLADIRVRAACGGRYTPYDSLSNGAALYGWQTGGIGSRGGHWRLLGTNNAAVPPQASSPLIDFRPIPSEAVDSAQSFWGPERRLYFQCRPNGTSGSGFAEVALDYIEVRIAYRTN